MKTQTERENQSKSAALAGENSLSATPGGLQVRTPPPFRVSASPTVSPLQRQPDTEGPEEEDAVQALEYAVGDAGEKPARPVVSREVADAGTLVQRDPDDEQDWMPAPEEQTDHAAFARQVRAGLQTQLRQLEGLPAEDTARARMPEIRNAIQQLDAGLSVERLREFNQRFQLELEESTRAVGDGRTRHTDIVGAEGIGRESTTTAPSADGLSESTTTTRTVLGPEGFNHAHTETQRQQRSTGVERSTSTTRSTEVGLGDFTHTQGTEISVTQSDGSTRSRSGSVAAGTGGITHSAEAEANYMNPDGSSRSTTSATDQGLVAGDGTLAGLRSESRSGTTETNADGTTQAATTSAHTTQLGVLHGPEGSGLGLTHSRESTRQIGDWTRRIQGSASGNFTIAVETVPASGADAERYRVTLTLHLGLSASGTGSYARQTGSTRPSGSLTGSAGGSGDLVYAHEMDEAAIRAYLQDVENVQHGRPPHTQRPELGSLARLRVAGHLARGRGDTNFGAAMSADQAAQLREGESVQLNLSGNLGLSGAATVGGFGVTGGATGTESRRMTIERDGEDGGHHPRIKITVRFASTRERSAGGSLEGASISATSGTSEGYGAVFRLSTSHADYQQHFNQIWRAATRTQLQEFVAGHAPLTVSHTVSSGESSDLSVGGFGQSLTTTSSQEHERQYLENGLAGSEQGASGFQVGALGSVESRVTTTVDENGEVGVDLTSTESTIDPGRSILGLVDEIERRGRGEVGAEALAAGPSDFLRERLMRMYSDLRTIHLEEAELNALVGRARDARNWSRCCTSPHPRADWLQLRTLLTSPQPTQEDVQHDTSPGHRFARILAQGRALGNFAANNDSRGLTCLENALRNWGGYSAGSEDLGALEEWPAALSEQHTRFTESQSSISAIRQALTGSLTEAQRTTLQRNIERTRSQLSGIRSTIRDADSISDRAQVEMLRTIDQNIRQLSTLERRLTQSAQPGTTTAPAAEGGDSDTAELRQELGQLESQLENAKARERSTLRGMLDHLPQSLGGRWETIHNIQAYMGIGPSAGDFDSAVHILGTLVEAQEPWIQNIRRIRSICRQLQIAPSAWSVGQHGTADRHRNEPDIDLIIRWYERILQRHPNRGWIETGFNQTTGMLRRRREY
ncbi:MAG: hypothetical protein IT260_20695 [Saprospiraceae bacterium]|nr:hypothetical protein [Saprospiraceae bacterium]